MGQSGNKLSQQEEDRVRRLKAQGLSVREIAHEEMVSPTTVQKILKSQLTSGTNRNDA